MKSQFPEHFRLSEAQQDDLFEHATYVFDTNILLNFYRYSDPTRKDLLTKIETIKDRLWLPHQVAKEFFDNRAGVISRQGKVYSEVISQIRDLTTLFEKTKEHPFLSEALHKKFKKVAEDVCTELEEARIGYTSRITEDDIQEAIADIFDNRVGPSYPENHEGELVKKGQARFAKKIPPGYEDASKDKDGGIRSMGDYIVWRQILDYAAGKDVKSVIFVTDDSKEDWWLRKSGKRIGPRPELRKEFADQCGGKGFYMYSSELFFRHLPGLEEGTLEEVKETSRSNTSLSKFLVALGSTLKEYESASHQLGIYFKSTGYIANLNKAIQVLRIAFFHLPNGGIDAPNFLEYLVEQIQFIYRFTFTAMPIVTSKIEEESENRTQLFERKSALGKIRNSCSNITKIIEAYLINETTKEEVIQLVPGRLGRITKLIDDFNLVAIVESE